MHVDSEAANRFVLIAIGLFGIVLYLGLLCAGISRFVSGVPRAKGNKKRSPNRPGSRRLRARKVSEG